MLLFLSACPAYYALMGLNRFRQLLYGISCIISILINTFSLFYTYFLIHSMLLVKQLLWFGRLNPQFVKVCCFAGSYE